MNFDELTWSDHPANPLIEPPWPEWMIADPTVLLPSESPDGKWHLFANSVWGIHHHTSEDGISWARGKRLFPGIRSFVIKHTGAYYIFNEVFLKPFETGIVVRRSEDLETWSEPKVALPVSRAWHKGILNACSCPCVVPHGDGFMMFYSASVILLPDCLFFEPKYIGVARASNIEGPYEPDETPAISPDMHNPLRNFGAGAIKVVFDEQTGTFWGFNNGIYKDERGRSRSSIMILKSGDGTHWMQAVEEPILKPEPGWKKALVYALDIKIDGDRAYLYYNARDGWFIGSERIGLAIGRKA